MSLIGMASTLIELTLYTSINYIISEKYYGTAYGIVQAVGTCGHAVGSLILGYILDIDTLEGGEVNVAQYHKAHTVLMIASLFGIILTIVLNIYDYQNK
mmetsp:Transcript_26619/g.25684  ORF Transcript_26619/g.25684 Transcript_26619/m.25684 type:complete len:99 (+) Transcript_26619:265-561(+)